MGDCKSCKKDCPSAKEVEPRLPALSRRAPIKKDLTSYLKNKPKDKSDDIPLTWLCQCPGSPVRMARYTCMTCLRSWAKVHSDEEIEKQIMELRQHRRIIAAERLERIHKEIRWNRRIPNE